MNFQNLTRDAWCTATLKEAVRLFHKERKSTDIEELSALAKSCADRAFQSRVNLMIGDQEMTAQQFLNVCLKRFGEEINLILAEGEKIEAVH